MDVSILEQVYQVDILGRGLDPLFAGAYDAIGESPLQAAARELASSLDKHESVAILTGFPILWTLSGETDGPPGAAVLAQVISHRNPIVVVTDRYSKQIMQRLLEEVRVEARIILIENLVRMPNWTTRFLDENHVKVLIAIERPGANRVGVHHNLSGLSITHLSGNTDPLFAEARRRGLLRIAIGDGGNELGMGLVEQLVRRYIPYGNVCRCPCRQGIAAAEGCDYLLIAGVSNLGGYALAAAVAVLGNLPYVHDAEQEARLVRSAIAAGAVDGVTGAADELVDGMPLTRSMQFVEKIRRLYQRLRR
ncbi:DUF4392 domain-containing protein [archaeon]|nr:DUF4392 domain-containing protein [archaeon]